MAASKRSKKVIQTEVPREKYVGQIEDPDSYYKDNPSWNFNTCDTDLWPFTEENVGELWWNEIFPRMKELEKQTWRDILLVAKKQNHSIVPGSLNSQAQKRLVEKHIEQEAVISLRINGTHRLYGYICESVFNVIWFDKDHGDNNTCVCRSHKKNT